MLYFRGDLFNGPILDSIFLGENVDIYVSFINVKPAVPFLLHIPS